MALRGGLNIDPSQLPAFGLQVAAPDKPSPIVGGLASGIHELLGLGGSALQGVGAIVDAPDVQDYGKQVAANQNATAQRVGRPDLEVAPWQAGGASIAPWLLYQGAKLAPTLAGYAAATALAPEAAVPAGLARIGATLPEFLGGAGLEAGANFAARRAALEAGTGFGKFVVGGGAFGGVTGFGQAIQSADQKPGGVDQSDAAQALAESPLYAAAGLMEPGFLRGALAGAEGKLVTRVAARALSGGAVGAVQSGVMAGLDQTFRPDLSSQDKFSNIVDAAMTGAAVGGMFGGLTGIRALKRADPNAVLADPDALGKTIDTVLALPAPTAFTDAAGRTVIGSGGDAVLRATPGEQSPLDLTPDNAMQLPQLQLGGPPVIANDLGQAAVGSEGGAAVRATPADIGFRLTDIPQAEPALPGPGPDRTAVDGSTIVVGRRDETGRFTNKATGVEQPPVVPDDTSRSFRNFTDAELTSASNALANKHEAHGLDKDQQLLRQKIDEELNFRNKSLTSDKAQSEVAGAVQRADQGEQGAGDQSSAAPAPANTPTIADRITELTQGLRVPASLKEKLAQARSENDIQDIVHDQAIVQGKGGVTVDALGKRTGVLDDTGKPTALADAISARKTEPGEQPASPTFQAEWKTDIQSVGQKDPIVRSLNPVNREDAMLQLYRALGNYDETRDTTDRSGVEKLAQKYGVLDENKKLTPAAVQLAERDPIPVEDAKAAAEAQGLKGGMSTMFAKGVAAYTGEGPEMRVPNADRAAAYQAGFHWAEEHNSVPKGALKQYVGREVTDKDVAAVEGKAPKPQVREVPPEVRQAQQVNEAIDNANLQPAKREGDIASLKRMVREGDIQGAMEGLRRVQRGDSLFDQPERAPSEPFKGARVDATSRALAGSRDKAQAELDHQRDAAGMIKEVTKAEAEQAIRKYELGLKIDAAHEEGSIDSRTRLSLINKLRQGRVGEVSDVVGPANGKIEGPIRAATNRAERRAALHRDLEAMVAEHARENEVPELNVDENGVLQGHRYVYKTGKYLVTDEDRRAASDLLSHVIDGDTPKMTMLRLAAMGGDLGKMAARFAKYVPDDIRFEAVTRQEMNKVLAGFDMKPDTPEDGPTQGLWSNPERTIYMSTAVFHPSVFLHEIAHAITSEHITQRTPIGKEMIRAFNYIKPFLPAGDYAATNAHEFMAEFMSRQQVRDYVRDHAQTIDSIKNRNIFQRIWDAIRSALGHPPQSEVERLLNLAEAAGGSRLGPDTISSSPLLMKPPQYAEHTKDTVSSVVDAVDRRVDLEGARGVLRRGQLYATSIHHITEFFGKPWFGTKVGDRDVNGVVEREQHTDFREAVQQRNAQLLTDVMDRAYALEHGDKKSFENINFVQQASEYGINPTRGWDQQTEEVRANPALKDKWQEFNNAYRSLQKKGHAGIYDDLRKFNDVLMLAQTSMSLHDHVATDKITAGRFDAFSLNPMRRFMDEQAREGHGLDGAHDFWNQHLDTQVKAMEDYAKQMERSPPPSLSGADKRDIRIGIGTMRDQIKTINKIREDLDNVPNFHLGRDGDYFVNMRLRLGEDGKVDPKALADAAERLSQFGSLNKVANRVISTVPDSRNDQSHVYIRVDNTVAQANLLKIAKQLQKEGIVRTDVEKDGTKTYGVIAGKRTDDRIRNALGGQWSDRLVSEIAANPHIKPEDRKMLETMIRAQALDLMPDNSLAKMASHREGVPGYNPDMLRSFNNRAKVAVDALAGMTVARDMTEAYANMRAAIKERQGNPDTPMAQRNGMTEVVDELSRHDKDFANAPRGSKALNQLQAMSGAFFLSANLAYPMVNLVQVPMVALPELGKKFGFIKSAKTLASVTPEALKIIRAIGQTGLKVSAARAADATLTTEALRKAGISKDKAEFLMQVANRGGVDIGGQSRELARNASGQRGSKVDQGLRIASSLGYYSETLSRLVVALASYHLHPEGVEFDKMVGNTVHTLKESMWDYSSPNTSRMLGRSGFLGPLTPLATQFMKYTAMLNEKLYREVHAAVGGDKEAARFLAGQLAMTTVFAGALGLPYAGVFASAYDRLKDLFDQGDQPSDIQASFRNGMADMFGKNAAEIIARGAPRAAGIDLSTRIGEQDILPFSKFIEDRRGLKDSLKDLESRAWGAPSSMMLNMATGAQRVAQGDLTGGIRQMLPLGLAGMVKSYQMTTQGYTDSKGNVLPMTPSAGAVLAQALGFNPATNAEYNEARQDQVVRQGLLSRQSQQMRNNIADAIIGGDHDKARELITQAQVFDKANPAYGVLQGVEGSIQRRRQGPAVAARLGTPLGISPKDRYAPQLTHYANIEYKAH